MKYWNRRLKDMAEYIPGEQPENLDEFIKLNTNESPFSPPASVLDAIRKAADASLRRYPNPTAMSVREAFAKQNNLSADNVFVANGSDEIFTLLLRGFIEADALAAFPYPSYSLYYTLAEANGVRYERIPLDQNLDLNFADFLKKKYALVIVCNPNNPTGKGIDLKALEAFASRFKGLLVVDEAYVDFYGETAIGLVREFDNIVVTRSFSKSYSLAGLRVGIAVAHADIVRGLLKLKDSYNVDRLAEAGALAALADRKGFKYNVGMVRDNKEFLEQRLEDLGFFIVPSRANFLFVRHPNVPAQKIYEELYTRKVLVRHFTGPVQSEYVRISIGSMMELRALVKELESIIKGG
ncbi:MAG TPA: histidinol-phosphate transaminase [Spirochaetota bacterium]|nr:histidinol-phosphate transaminase [Spirochaetota bacterium]OPZ37887.1 MAG: Histidinol-phosphate aminotransferase [Spirochaetes bacterium ADurb.BinA120]HNU91193.1 histidinol-phosphate transaminase [Spirochaetota bacterium]HPI15019.1 histidinol-phosphate transaminase [Spirochaetota bacterium]HPV97554.1 histidinol-phosphate transaminase [Spirochaetota bacterium]